MTIGRFKGVLLGVALLHALLIPLAADVGDPQLRSDHPWYPGELALSTFDRLFATQAVLYERVTGETVDSEEDKALASWLWRNTHYWHAETGRRDLWGEGLGQGKDQRLREYWNGLFAYGFGLCGTTHSQWTAEFEHLLGHGRGRGVGVAGHNAFEVFLRGGAYKGGRWALLDHDLSTVIFDAEGKRLLGLAEIHRDYQRWIKRDFKPERQRGWLVCGLHPSDGNSYKRYAVAEYLPGYAGPPPMVHLRRGERMRRYFAPGLEDGKTFVFWGRNYGSAGIPGPERSRTWVNQPEKMHGSKNGTSHVDGQARFANAEFVYRPDFESADYREGIVEENADAVIFEFQSPYIIAATPPGKEPWGIYEAGCRNGLVVSGKTKASISVSLDRGRTWSEAVSLGDEVDLTDQVKGRCQYLLKIGAGAPALRGAALEIRTVCQANVAVLPRLKDGGTTLRYEASGQRVLSAGPELGLAQTFLSEGAFGEKKLGMRLHPRFPVTALHAAAHVASGSPPRAEIKYQVEVRVGEGAWRPLIKDWTVPRRGDEPGDFWSQSFCYGSGALAAKAGEPVEVRFHNNGGRPYLRAELHLIQQTGKPDPVKVSYAWQDDRGRRTSSRTFEAAGEWSLDTGKNVRTEWVEMAVGGDPR